MRLNDALLGLLLVVLAGAIAWRAQFFPAVPGQTIGASAFPTLIAAGFAFCGVVLIVSGLRERAPAVIWSDWTQEPRAILNVLATIGAVVFYLLAARTLGFIPTTFLILLALQRLFGVGWAATLSVAILVPIGMQYVFGKMLLVPLPWGLLAPVRLW
jgi:putative tricarboxylic transport membrane protein